MPTVVTKTIKPGGGGDYTSLQAANDALAGNLVSADQQLDLVCYAGGNLGTLDMGVSWTTDATRFVRITVASGERHLGVYDTGKAYLSGVFASDNPGLLRRMPDYTRIEYLQIEQTGDDNNLAGIAIPSAAVGIRIQGCLIKAAPSSTTFWNTTRGISVGTDAPGSHYIWNCLIYGFNVKSGNRGIYTNNHTTGKTYVYHCTIIDCDVGIIDGFSDVVAKNCLVQCDTTDFDSVGGTGSDYNASGDGTAPGANSRTGQTFTFVNAGAKDYHLAAGDAGAKGYGTDLSSDADLPVTDDIDGETRSTPFDIGADEVQAATLEQEGYRFRNDDGSESGATWQASQDTDVAIAKNTNTRLRTLINATGDPTGKTFRVEYKKPGSTQWHVLGVD